MTMCPREPPPTAWNLAAIWPSWPISLLDEQGMPKMHDELLDQVFSKDYYAKKGRCGALAILRRYWATPD